MNNVKPCPGCGKPIALLGYKEIAEILNWDTRRVGTYRKRGHIPEPDFELKAGPVWFENNPALQKFLSKWRSVK